MTQLALPAVAPAPLAPEAYRHVARRQLVLRRVAINAASFRSDFPPWLEKNIELWEAFEREANIVWSEGRKHYGARTLWEVMRHHTRHREEGEFKLNNNHAPDLARLYMLMYPERDGFFELRGREAQAA